MRLSQKPINARQIYCCVRFLGQPCFKFYSFAFEYRKNKFTSIKIIQFIFGQVGAFMRRPFALVGFTYIFALLAASYMGLGMCMGFAVLLTASSFVLYFGLRFLKWRREIIVVFLSVAAAFFMFSIYETVNYNPVYSFGGSKAVISGQIADLPQQNGGEYAYTIKTASVEEDGRIYTVKTKIRYKTDYVIPAKPLDNVKAVVDLSVPPTANGTGFDSRSYYKSKGVYLFAVPDGTAKPVVKKVENKGPYYYAIMLRQYISSAMQQYIGGDEGALADSILIGDTSSLPDTISSDFKTTGISHILAVSGTQVSIIMQYLLILASFLRLPRRPFAAVTAGAVVAYMAVTGFSPSVMRAGIMGIVYLCAVLVQRDADTMNSLGLAVLLICLVNPYAATDIGLLLSFTATLGMVLLSGKLFKFAKSHMEKMTERTRKVLILPVGVLCETIGASMVTFPIIVIAFGRVSAVSLIANMVEVPISLLVTLSAAVVAVLAPLRIFVFIIKPVAVLVRLACAFMAAFAHMLVSLPFASISVAFGFVTIFIVFSCCVLCAYRLFRGKGANIGVCAVCVLLSFAVGLCSYVVAGKGVLAVSVFPYGGTATTVFSMDSHAVIVGLSNGDPQYDIEKYLKSRNIDRVDKLILTSYSKKTVNAANKLIADIPVDSVYIPGAYAGGKNSFAGAITRPSQTMGLGGLQLTMLPDKSSTNIIALVSYGQSRAVVADGLSNKTNYSEYNLESLKAGLMTYSGNVPYSVAKGVSPQYASGGTSATSRSTLESLGCDVAAVTSDKTEFLTRGNGEYIVGD